MSSLVRWKCTTFTISLGQKFLLYLHGGTHYHQLYTSLLLPLLQRCSYFYLPDSAYQKTGIWRIHEPTDSISRPHPSLIAWKGRRISAVERIGVSGAYHIFGTYRIFASFHVSNFLLQHTFERFLVVKNRMDGWIA